MIKTESEIMRNWKGDKCKPLVSIISATYNHERYLADALDSFLMQETDFPFEILVGEDCSTDKTRTILIDYAKKYPNIIKPILWDKNVGASKNWITLFEKSKGEYIANCEGDDYWTTTNKLQTQFSQMLKNPLLDFSFHLSETVDMYGNIKKPKIDISQNKIYSVQDIIVADFHLVQTNTIMFKKMSLYNLDLGLLSQSPVGDVWIRIASSIPNGALFINQSMSAYRIRSSGSWSSTNKENEKFLAFVEKMLQSIEDFDLYWNYTYSKEFNIYKNMFIKTVMRKNIEQKTKQQFMKKYSKLLSLKNYTLWHLLYRHPSFLLFGKKIKYFMKGICDA